MSAKKEPKPRQPWLKRVLIPFWVVQILLMLVLIGINVGLVEAYWIKLTKSGIIVISFASTVSFLIIVEIILFALRRLHPMAYLCFQVFKTTLWTVLFIISMVGLARDVERGYLGSGPKVAYLLLGVVEVVVILLSFIGTLIYASVIYHRHRNHKPYHRSSPPIPSSLISSSSNTNEPPPTDDINRQTNSTSAPELLDIYHNNHNHHLTELDPGVEIREMPTTEDGEKGRGRKVVRELEGEVRVFELSAGGSLRGGKGGGKE